MKLTTLGQKYGNFEVTRINEIKELQCTLIELAHLPTGAKIMHIANEDTENLFCLSFQTLPYSSNGVAHILEHTVLCGSKKFPIKDPFFAMNRRSLNTFMNALTGADFTCYPAATQNSRDFYNLLEVYLDAVFQPKLDRLSFLQEGHRLEFANPLDPKTNLEYKGIVFNEMKGSLSSADARLNESMNLALFPDITYGYNSGGDPKSIPDLTHEELVDFHKKYYHPSRCLFFFYGNLKLTGHLDFIEEHALKGVEKLPPLPEPKLQPRFLKKKQLDAYYPISSDEDLNDKTFVSFGWLTCNILEQEEILALSVIEIILMNTDASPLKRALMNSGLCKQASCFIETDYTEMPFIITLRGCNPGSSDALELIISNTLQKIVKEDISEQTIENALHRLEFYRSEITGDHTPFGLSLFFRSGLIKQHGADPKHGMKIHALFETLRDHIKRDPHYLAGLIEKHLLDNPHFVRITMMPDKELAAKEIAEELETLKKIQSKFSSDDAKKIIKQAEDLNLFQKKQDEEDLSVLPKVTLEDVDKKTRQFPLTEKKFDNLKVYHHECFTNEIVYADLIFDLPYIEEKDLSILRLFTILLTQIGAANRNYLENLDYVQARTGGIFSSLALNPQAEDSDCIKPSFHIHGKALRRYTKDLFSIIKDTVSSPDFSDKKRIKEVVLKHYISLQSSFNQNALKYAINLSASALNSAGAIVNDWYGIKYYEEIQKIALNIDTKIDPLLKKLQEMQEKVL
ncbi:MAG TPA: insulinase family protein, partial [Parachlamydiaceae bacterium]|nr:insulinase family protein [Parachlamydiaceae bacterium]